MLSKTRPAGRQACASPPPLLHTPAARHTCTPWSSCHLQSCTPTVTRRSQATPARDTPPQAHEHMYEGSNTTASLARRGRQQAFVISYFSWRTEHTAATPPPPTTPYTCCRPGLPVLRRGAAGRCGRVGVQGQEEPRASIMVGVVCCCDVYCSVLTAMARPRSRRSPSCTGSHRS